MTCPVGASRPLQGGWLLWLFLVRCAPMADVRRCGRACRKRTFAQIRAGRPLSTVDSVGRRNTRFKTLCGCFEPERLARSPIKLSRDLVQALLRVDTEVGALGEVLAQQPVGVLVGAALPRTLRIAEVDRHIGRQRKALVLRHLLAAVPR